MIIYLEINLTKLTFIQNVKKFKEIFERPK